VTIVDPDWSLHKFLEWFRPHEGWRSSFAGTYAKAIESDRPDVRLQGWRAAAMILGDMNALLFCLFVCHHGRSLVGPESDFFLAHMDLCLWDLGLATPAGKYEGKRSMPIVELCKPENFLRDTDVAQDWLAEQVRPFGGSMERAAVFAMRCTAARLGLLRGPKDPSIEEVLDVSLWERAESVNGPAI
jgi:hypothetical protein